MIVETYLPFDYFALMVGVLIDQKMFMKFVKCEFKRLYQKFTSLGFDPSILAFQWFVCIFTYNMPEQVSTSPKSIASLLSRNPLKYKKIPKFHSLTLFSCRHPCRSLISSC